MKRILLLFLFTFMSCFKPEIIINSKDYQIMRERKANNENKLILPNNMYIEETKRGNILRLKEGGIYFRISSANIDIKYANIINNIKEFLDKNEHIRLIVEGHSDSAGKENVFYKNIELSKLRSIRSIDILTSLSINKNRLISYYYSDYMPYYINNEGCNRRLEFIIITCEDDYNKYTREINDVVNKVIKYEN